MTNTEHLEEQDVVSGSTERDAPERRWAYFGYHRVPEDEKEKLVLDHFNTVARHYDRMNTLLSFGLHYVWKRSAIKMLGLRPGDRVVDVCGGTGDLSRLAARASGPKGRVVLYDINRAMMKVGRSKIAKRPGAREVYFVQGNAEWIALPDGQFDAAVVGFGIRNLTSMKRGLEEMYRVLKKGGRLMCLEFSMPTASVLRWLYNVYSFHIMPLLGQILVGSRQAYTYLPESIRMFPLPEELTSTLESVGFSNVIHWKLTNGIAVVHMGVKS